MLLPTTALAGEAGATAFGAVVRAIGLYRKPAPDSDDRADQDKRDGHDLENGFHEWSNGSIAMFDNYIGTVLPSRSGSLQKRQRAMVSQISDFGLIRGSGVISVFSQQQESPKCKMSSIAFQTARRFIVVAGLLRGFWQGSLSRCWWSVCSSCRSVAMASWKTRLSLRRYIRTFEIIRPFGAVERGLPC